MADPQQANVPEGWSVVSETTKAPTAETERRPQGSVSALAMQAASKLPAPMAHAATAFATSPTAAKTASSLARGGTTLAAIGRGLFTGNPSDIIAAPMEGWAAGKGGYFLAKGAQSIANPIARALTAAEPLAKAVGAAAGPQGVLDLAQMAEPNRRDIGFFGIGGSIPDLEVLTKAVQLGANPAQAAAAIAKGDPKRFGSLMMAYANAKKGSE